VAQAKPQRPFLPGSIAPTAARSHDELIDSANWTKEINREGAPVRNPSQDAVVAGSVSPDAARDNCRRRVSVRTPVSSTSDAQGYSIMYFPTPIRVRRAGRRERGRRHRRQRAEGDRTRRARFAGAIRLTMTQRETKGVRWVAQHSGGLLFGNGRGGTSSPRRGDGQALWTRASVRNEQRTETYCSRPPDGRRRPPATRCTRRASAVSQRRAPSARLDCPKPGENDRAALQRRSGAWRESFACRFPEERLDAIQTLIDRRRVRSDRVRSRWSSAAATGVRRGTTDARGGF